MTDDDWVKNLTYISHVVPISAEELRLRTVGPTKEEAAEWARNAELREAEASAQRERYETRRREATGFERKVLDLHTPVASGYQSYACHGCDWGSYAQDYPEWPCRTAELALEDE